MDESDLKMKYIVFKIDDIKDILFKSEQECFWSLLEKIIFAREKQKELKLTDADMIIAEEQKYENYKFMIETEHTHTSLSEKKITQELFFAKLDDIIKNYG